MEPPAATQVICQTPAPGSRAQAWRQFGGCWAMAGPADTVLLRPPPAKASVLVARAHSPGFACSVLPKGLDVCPGFKHSACELVQTLSVVFVLL